MNPNLLRLEPTPLLRQAGGRLLQTARLVVQGETAPGDVQVRIIMPSAGEWVTPVVLAPGETPVEVEAPVIEKAGEGVCEVRRGDRVLARAVVPWQPPRKWTVHVVQLSHHDVGYTDLASHVLSQHDRWLDATIDLAAATREYPEAARFRAVIEQTWSVDHYLRHAPPARAAALVELMRRGDLELTALFGNLTTELCGSETLVRSVYPAFRLGRTYGLPLLSAEHNDIPGFSWGLSQVLTEAGVRLFCPGLPNYYAWGDPKGPSFWDEAALFGRAGIPGAFWWEAPSGKRVLFWCNNRGCGGPAHPALPGLAERLQELQGQGYAYPVLRWPVSGANRDNSPYGGDFARTIRDWNARWAFPRLVCSTNARFYADFQAHLPADLPVFRGDVPGQDYPVGAASTAAATAVNRRAHAEIPAAEALAVAAEFLEARPDPTDWAERVNAAYEEALWHDEHTWGHHFPAGPTACAAELEKAVHAYRAATLAHDVANKAMARIADAVRIQEPDIHLVVFNALPYPRSGTVVAPLRELDNCGSEIGPDEQGNLRGWLLHNRMHVNPPPELVAGRFDLVDVTTGEEVPYQLRDLESPFSAEPFAAQRWGLSAGGKRYGFFEVPSGLARDLVFHADAVPAMGYRTFRLRPRAEPPGCADGVTTSGSVVESPFYRLELDPATGWVRSLRDRETGREWVAASAEHPFGSLLVREPRGEPRVAELGRIEKGRSGALTGSVGASFSAPGHPRIEVTYTLYAREKRLEVDVMLLKDPTPLLEIFVAFPFNLPGGRFRCEGPLCVTDPVCDRLPGAFADRLTAQNWVAATGDGQTLIWSSQDAPVVSLARLWPGRVSPAHSAVVREDLVHPGQTGEALTGGTIYSLLAANNFGTNFCVSQSGTLRFRYRMTTAAGALNDADAVRRGNEWVTPFSALFTKHPRPRRLPPMGGALEIDPPTIRLLALKRAEAGDGWILRLWNPGDQAESARVILKGGGVVMAQETDLAEIPKGLPIALQNDGFSLVLAPLSIRTVHLCVG